MKMIIAIVQPQQLPDIKEALLTAGFEHMTCTNILGTVANRHEEQKYRGASQEIFLFQKIRLEIGVADEKVGGDRSPVFRRKRKRRFGAGIRDRAVRLRETRDRRPWRIRPVKPIWSRRAISRDAQADTLQ